MIKFNKCRLFLLIVGLCLYETTQAQQGLNVSSNNANGSNGNVNYVVGQMFYHTHTSANGFVSEGVLQTYEVTVTGVNESMVTMLQANVYPNPTLNDVQLNVNLQADLCYDIHNVQGELLQSAGIKEEQTILSLDKLPSGIYILTIRKNNEFVQSFKIIKNQ